MKNKELEECDMKIQHAILAEVLTLHPDHLTTEELVLRMEDTGDAHRVALIDMLRALKSFGLVRINGEVVEPTYAALRCAALFELS